MLLRSEVEAVLERRAKAVRAFTWITRTGYASFVMVGVFALVFAIGYWIKGYPPRDFQDMALDYGLFTVFSAMSVWGGRWLTHATSSESEELNGMSTETSADLVRILEFNAKMELKQLDRMTLVCGVSSVCVSANLWPLSVTALFIAAMFVSYGLGRWGVVKRVRKFRRLRQLQSEA